jgi:hypothetical protein
VLSSFICEETSRIINSFLILFYGDLLTNDRITNISIAINPTTRFFSITRRHALFIYEVASHTVRYVTIMLPLP